MVATPWRLDLRRPYIQLPPPDSVSELLSLDQWVDFESEGEAGVDFRVPNTRRPVIRHPSVESMPELPVTNQRVDFDFEGEAGAEFRGPDLRLPLIQIPQPDPMPELPSMGDYVHFDSDEEMGAESRAMVVRGPISIELPSVDSPPPSPTDSQWGDDNDPQGMTGIEFRAPDRIHGSECVAFSANGPGEVNDWWFEAGSEQHAQHSSNKLLQFS